MPVTAQTTPPFNLSEGRVPSSRATSAPRRHDDDDRGIDTHPRQKADRRTAREWRALIVKFSRSGETRTQFCERHGLALSTFDRWRNLLREEPTAVSQTLPSPRYYVPAPTIGASASPA